MDDIAIREIDYRKELDICAAVIRESFATLAETLNITRENCPTHPSFITDDEVISLVRRGLRFYGLSHEGRLAGVVGVRRVDEQVYSVEKLAVLPEVRHCGYGRRLMDHACDLIRLAGGKRITISVIDENTVLKEWYLGQGFRVTETKRYEQLPFTVCLMEKDA
jgi:diamine N-acetyltransferase